MELLKSIILLLAVLCIVDLSHALARPAGFFYRREKRDLKPGSRCGLVCYNYFKLIEIEKSYDAERGICICKARAGRVIEQDSNKLIDPTVIQNYNMKMGGSSRK